LLLAGCGSGLSLPQIVEESADLPVIGQSTASRGFVLRANVDLEIRVRTSGVDVRAELVVGDGGPVLRANAPDDRLGVITFHLPAGDRRVAEMRIIGEDHARNVGRASLLVQAMPVITTKDRMRLEAVRLEAAGCAALIDSERAAEAAAKFAEASTLRRKAGDAAGGDKRKPASAGLTSASSGDADQRRWSMLTSRRRPADAGVRRRKPHCQRSSDG
jgi:hypothetical protein